MLEVSVYELHRILLNVLYHATAGFYKENLWTVILI